MHFYKDLFAILLLPPLILPQASAFDGEMTVKPGEDVPLRCPGPTGDTLTLLQWTRPDLKSQGYVFFYRNGRVYENYHHPSFQGRVRLRDKPEDGDVSVVLRNVTVNDTGTYECRIITSKTERNEKVHAEHRDLVHLTVTDPGPTAGRREGGGDTAGPREGGGDTSGPREGGGDTAGGREGGGDTAGGREGGGDTAGGREGGGDTGVYIVWAVVPLTLLVVAVVVVVVGLLLKRRRCLTKASYRRPSEKTQEQEQQRA